MLKNPMSRSDTALLRFLIQVKLWHVPLEKEMHQEIKELKSVFWRLKKIPISQYNKQEAFVQSRTHRVFGEGLEISLYLKGLKKALQIDWCRIRNRCIPSLYSFIVRKNRVTITVARYSFRIACQNSFHYSKRWYWNTRHLAIYWNGYPWYSLHMY